MAEIKFTNRAKKDLKNLDHDAQEALIEEIESLLLDPRPTHSKPLKGNWKGYFRLRKGSYRVIYHVCEQDIIIERAGHRKDVYE